MATVIDKKTILRDKRAQGIAAMGLVSRNGERFEVQTPSLRGRRASYEVWRDESGKVRCSCLEFEEGTNQDPTFRCEHILAVKHFLAPKRTEENDATAAQSQLAQPAQTAQPTQAAQPEQVAAPAPVNNSQEELQAASVGAEQPDLNQEKAEPTRVRSLASARSRNSQNFSKEQEMKHQEMTVVERSNDVSEMHHDETEASAHVVPLAFSNVLRTLRQPVDPKLVRTREGWTDRQGNKHMVDYIEWHTVADTLDRIAPTWSHAVKNITQIGDIVAVTAAITIDGVTREGVGTGTADNETGIKKAEHDALKRAAIKFGLARDLYRRESEAIEQIGGAPDEGEFPRDPLAKSMADLVTPKQLGMIRALAREAGVDVDEECQAQLRCRAEELSKRAASSFIDHLKNLHAASANSTMRRAS